MRQQQQRQQRPQPSDAAATGSYRSKLQVAALLFAAFAYRLASEHRPDWELAPVAYFDFDEAFAEGDAARLVRLTTTADGDDDDGGAGWLTHAGGAGGGWLVELLAGPPTRTSLRTLAAWPHRVLARLPDGTAGAVVGLDAELIGGRLFAVAQTSSGRLHVFATSTDATGQQQKEPKQLAELLSFDPLLPGGGLDPALLSGYAPKPLSMAIVRAHCKPAAAAAAAAACHLIVAAFRLADRSRPVGLELNLNQTAANLLPPIVMAFNLHNGSLVWQNSLQQSDLRADHDLEGDATGLGHFWKLEWTRHLMARKLVNAKSLESVLPVYRDIMPFAWHSDADATLLTACLHCPPAAGGRHGNRRRRDGNVLALRLGDSVALLDPGSGSALHRLRLDGRRGAYAVVDVDGGGRPVRYGVGENCTGTLDDVADATSAAAAPPLGGRRFDDLCDEPGTAGAAASAAAVPLLLPAAQAGGWAGVLGHLLGRPRPAHLALFLAGDGALVAHEGATVAGGPAWRVATPARWEAAAARAGGSGGDTGGGGPFLVALPGGSASAGVVLAAGSGHLAAMDASDGRQLASHTLPCRPSGAPVPLGPREVAIRCPRMLLRFRLRPLPPDFRWLGFVCAAALAGCLAVAFAFC